MELFLDPVKFWLLLARLTGFFIMSPGVSELNVPGIVRAVMVLWLSVFLVPQIPNPPVMMLGVPDLMFQMGSELLAGLGFGFIMQLLFAGIRFGGIVVDSELGLLAAQQLNPANPFSGGLFNRLYLMVALFYFWVLDYFNLSLMILHQSFIAVPVGSMASGIGDLKSMLLLAGGIFGSGLTLAAPIMAVMFCVNVAMGFLARAVQGIPIFFEVFTLKVVLGVVAALTFMPLALVVIRSELERFVPEAAKYWQGLVVRG
jgi:flagellar biosynthetic protein FliR